MADIAYDAERDALQFKRMQSIRYGVMLSVYIGSWGADHFLMLNGGKGHEAAIGNE